jgi:hypothetical protein
LRRRINCSSNKVHLTASSIKTKFRVLLHTSFVETEEDASCLKIIFLMLVQ